MGLKARHPVFRCLRTNKGADQPAHQHRLINAFVIHLLECILSKFASSEFSIFYQVSVADKTGLNLALWKPRRQVLRCRGPMSKVLQLMLQKLIYNKIAASKKTKQCSNF